MGTIQNISRKLFSQFLDNIFENHLQTFQIIQIFNRPGILSCTHKPFTSLPGHNIRINKLDKKIIRKQWKPYIYYIEKLQNWQIIFAPIICFLSKTRERYFRQLLLRLFIKRKKKNKKQCLHKSLHCTDTHNVKQLSK